MAFAQIQFHSEVLGRDTSACVILPEKRDTDDPAAVLLLLHGRSDDHTSWIRRTSIERYVTGRNLVVLMPDANLSYYTDMKHGGRYLSYIGEELPRLARSFFRISEERDSAFVAGVSMGGYGAFKTALTFPQTFSRAGSLSGALDIAGRIELGKKRGDAEVLDMFSACFGDPPLVQGTENDLFHLLAGFAGRSRPAPALWQCCGAEDFLLEGNRKFRSACMEYGLPLVYEEGPGDHVWNYWDGKIQDFLNWLH